MGRKIVISLVACMLGCSLYAQSPAESAMQEINRIKSQGDVFLYAESTNLTWQEAVENAKYLLNIEIDLWVKSTGRTETGEYIAKVQNYILEIRSMRGSLTRAFLYVNKNDIISSSDSVELVAAPAIVEQKSTAVEAQYKPTAFEQDMMSVIDANNIGTYIKRLKAEGKIESFGKYIDMPSSIDCYLFVYNREMQIPAYLKRQGQSYINIKTGESDNITNYHGCGAYWFQLK